MVGAIMGQFINDTLQKQIERGEVFYRQIGKGAQPPGSDYEFIVNTDSNELVLFLNVVSYTELFTFEFKEGVSTTSDGTQRVPDNMKMSSTNTIGATIYEDPTGVAGGTQFFPASITPTIPDRAWPFSMGSGVVLGANEKYYFHLNRNLYFYYCFRSG